MKNDIVAEASQYIHNKHTVNGMNKIWSQVTFIYVALYIIQIVSKQLNTNKQENNSFQLQL